MEEEFQQFDEWKNQLILFVVERGFGLIVAGVMFYLGFLLGNAVSRLIIKLAEKRAFDTTLARFFAGCAKLTIIVLTGIIALSKAGIAITPFIALLGASAFGLSLAVQGPISNYGAGVVLIITRPFRVGDTLTINGLTGRIDNISLGTTLLINDDEEVITIPNRKVLGEIFINSYENRVVEGIVGIDYAASPQLAISAIKESIAEVADLPQSREPEVGIDSFGDSSINIGYRVWVPMADYHKKRFTLNLAIFEALKKANIQIPFPQRDVHIISKED